MRSSGLIVWIRNALFTLVLVACLALSGNSLFTMHVQADSGYCYKVTPSANKAVYDYLNEIYINKYPELGLEYLYGTKKDKADLEKVAEIIFKGCINDREKCVKASRWVKKNLHYAKHELAQLPIDVLTDREANCFGYAMLMAQLLRLERIPAVVITGGADNMQEKVKLDDKDKFDHAWVMAYHDGGWYLFDPFLFSFRHRYGIILLTKL